MTYKIEAGGIRRGYTLLELVVVVVIIGILASVASVQYIGAVEKGRKAEASSVMSDIVGAEKAYYVENNAYTTTITDLHNYDSVPVSPNFTFSVPSTDASSGYVQATRVSSAGGRETYYMCIKSSKIGDTTVSCP